MLRYKKQLKHELIQDILKIELNNIDAKENHISVLKTKDKFKFAQIKFNE